MAGSAVSSQELSCISQVVAGGQLFGLSPAASQGASSRELRPEVRGFSMAGEHSSGVTSCVKGPPHFFFYFFVLFFSSSSSLSISVEGRAVGNKFF